MKNPTVNRTVLQTDHFTGDLLVSVQTQKFFLSKACNCHSL